VCPFRRCKIHMEHVSNIDAENNVSIIDAEKCMGILVSVIAVDIACDEFVPFW